MRGQLPVFEAVLIFGIGVAIFILCYAVFSSHQQSFNTFGVHAQLNNVQNVMISYILLLTGKDANSSVRVDLPRTIANLPYKIVLNKSGLFIESELGTRHHSLYGLNKTFGFDGSVNSIRGIFTIKRGLDKIYIEQP